MKKRALYPLFLILLLACKEDNMTKNASLEVNLDKGIILSLVNGHRASGATCGSEYKPSVGDLAWDDALALAAANHSNDMQQKNYFSHTGLNGSSFSERVESAGFDGSPVGENIASGYQTEQAVIEGWINSEGHCVNIMSANATHIGVARSAEGALWTMVLGRK